ncbi:MAG: DUF2723 domain-containing protein [Candidatus Hydrogenedentes bacterium]|nr:DUF2723 domain-containing protein [Candidatus Hydrogenedentota bacterium]
MAGIWLFSRLGPGVVFGPWQGYLLQNRPVLQVPLLSSWLAQLALQCPIGSPPWRLNVLSAILGALASGTLAFLAATLARAMVSTVEAIFAGVAAGLLFATVPLMTYAGTAAGPTTLTVLLALLSIAFLLLGLQPQARSHWLTASALSAGLASANHPAFGVFLVLLVGATILTKPAASSGPRIILFMVAGFVLGAIMPLAYAFTSGESLREFLSHALNSPYPVLGGAAPKFGFAQDLTVELAPLLLVLALCGTYLCVRPVSRAPALVCAFVFVTLGPFLPFLTNPVTPENQMVDFEAPRLVALAMVALFTACGLTLLTALTLRHPRSRPKRLVAIVIVVLIALNNARASAPTRKHSIGEQLSADILRDCPKNAFLISGDSRLTSLLLTAQPAEPSGENIIIFDSQALQDPFKRRRLTTVMAGAAVLSEAFPDENAWTRWEQERPFEVRQVYERLDQTMAHPADLQDLALWDFIRDNCARRPICLVGLKSPWLTARAQVLGFLLCYPRTDRPSPENVQSRLGNLLTEIAGVRDPGVQTAFTQVLLPLSECARDQGQSAAALRYAELAASLSPLDPQPRLAISRAAARLGDGRLAGETISAYLQLLSPSRTAPDVSQILREDLTRCALESEFGQLLESDAGSPNHEACKNLAMKLWEADELVVLIRGYDTILARNPGDMDSLYQQAAALAQIGDLGRARTNLAALVNVGQTAPMMLWEQLHNDGRFSLLRQSSPQFRGFSGTAPYLGS